MTSLISILVLLSLFMIGVNLFMWLVSIFITFYKYKEQEMCIRQLDLINNTLEEFGISKEYDRLRKEIKWSLISWIILICAINIFDALSSIYIEGEYFINSVIVTIITSWTMEYSLHVNTILDVIIVFILRYIGNRLDKINDCIAQLSETENCGIRCVWKKSSIVSRHYGRKTEYKRMLWTAMHLHLRLCRVTHTINALYGMQMTVQMAAYFVICTGLVYFQYHVLLRLSHYGSIKWISISSKILWTTFFLVKLLVINHICESVSAKAERTKLIIYRLTNLSRFADIYDEIYQFGLQISLHPLRLSGMGLFYFGYKFVQSFIVWVFTITLLLVQANTTLYKTIV